MRKIFNFFKQNFFVLLLFPVILLFVNFDKNTVLPERGLCAHRGANNTHPENTLSAFKEAIRLGAQMIEFDVRMSKDGKLVIIHDATVDRTTNGHGKVADLTFAELRKLDAGSWKNAKFKGEKIPTLSETLDIMPKNIWLNIHIKGDTETAKKVAKLILEKKRKSQAVLACKTEAINAVRQIDDSFLICNMERLSNSKEYVNGTIAIKADFIQLKDRADNSLLTLIKKLKQNNIKINYFRTNSPEKLKKLFSAGIDFILVDNLKEMMAVAKEIDIQKVSLYGGQKFKELMRFKATEARQGIAVDEKYIYVIGTREIGKYDKKTKKLIKRWCGEKDGPIIHLDSGVIVNGKLYCAHSNYPGIPMTSSVEIWDAESLQHINTHSFGIGLGSCTWIDRYHGYWWAVFAYYDKFKSIINKDNRWTILVKFDDEWRAIETWVFPKEVLEKFSPMSNSGGSWGPDGMLYCTGHDQPELYVMKLPKAGSILKFVKKLSINNDGQGIAWDRSNRGVIYTIKKKERLVVVSKILEIQ